MATRVNNVGAAKRLISVVAGSLLIGQVFRKFSAVKAVGAIVGADLVCRGVRGQSPLYKAFGVNTAAKRRSGSQLQKAAPRVQRSITIGRSREELYQFWRNQANLSRIMAHFAEVTPHGNGSTHWRVHGPLKQVFEWDSQSYCGRARFPDCVGDFCRGPRFPVAVKCSSGTLPEAAVLRWYSQCSLRASSRRRGRKPCQGAAQST